MVFSTVRLLESAAAVLAAVAWPVALLIAASMFRAPLVGLLQRLSSFRHGDLEAQFTSGLERANQLAPRVLKVVKPSEVTLHVDDADRVEALFRLAKVSARGAVMDAWRELELAAVGAGLKRERSVRGPLGRVSGIAAVEKLAEAGDLSDSVLHLYKELRSLRNQAIGDDFAISESDARQYVLLCLQLASFFRRLERAEGEA